MLPADDPQAVRVPSVIDTDGLAVGRLLAVYADPRDRTPRWARVGLDPTDGVGSRDAFVPLAGATRTGGRLQVRYRRSVIVAAPGPSPDVELAADEESALAAYYRQHVTTGTARTARGSALATGWRDSSPDLPPPSHCLRLPAG